MRNLCHAGALAACILVMTAAAIAGACSPPGEENPAAVGRPSGETSDPTDAGAVAPSPSQDASINGSGESEAGCHPYESDASLTSPTVSFTRDVLPIFHEGCGIGGSACHTANEPVLVGAATSAGMATLLAGIVGKPSNEDPAMNFVTPGDPGRSYVMHKMDGDQCALAAACAAGSSPYHDCGSSMPYQSPALPQDQRDTVRRWISQGAKKN